MLEVECPAELCSFKTVNILLFSHPKFSTAEYIELLSDRLKHVNLCCHQHASISEFILKLQPEVLIMSDLDFLSSWFW